MKTLLITLTALTLLSCQKPPKENYAPKINSYNNGTIEIVIIDSCEYILSDVYAGNSICHKGNCKFCKIRNNQNF